MIDYSKMGVSDLVDVLKIAGPTGADFGGQQISAQTLRDAIDAFCTGSGGFADIRIRNAHVRGKLHLDNLRLGGYLRMEECHFLPPDTAPSDGKLAGLDLRHAVLRRLKFLSCEFIGPVECDVINVHGDVNFSLCHASAGVSFTSARVDGRLVIEGCEIGPFPERAGRFTPGSAFDGAKVRVGSGLQFRAHKGPECKETSINGRIDLQYAEIGGSLEFEGSNFGKKKSSNILPASVDASNAEVVGFTFLRNSHFVEPVIFFAARMRLISVEGSTLESTGDDPALYAEACQISTNFVVSCPELADESRPSKPTEIDGLSLRRAHVGGSVQLGSEKNSDAGKRADIRKDAKSDEDKEKIPQ